MKNKKIISLVSAMAMTASCFSGLIIAQAEDNGVLWSDTFNGYPTGVLLNGDGSSSKVSDYIQGLLLTTVGRADDTSKFVINEKEDTTDKYLTNQIGRFSFSNRDSKVGFANAKDYAPTDDKELVLAFKMMMSDSTSGTLPKVTVKDVGTFSREDAKVEQNVWSDVKVIYSKTATKVLVNGEQVLSSTAAALSELTFPVEAEDKSEAKAQVSFDDMVVYLTANGATDAVPPAEDHQGGAITTPTPTPEPESAPVVTAPAGANIIANNDFNSAKVERIMVLGPEQADYEAFAGMALNIGSRKEANGSTNWSVIQNKANDNMLRAVVGEYSTSNRTPRLRFTPDTSVLGADDVITAKYAVKLNPNATNGIPAEVVFSGSYSNDGAGNLRDAVAKITTDKEAATSVVLENSTKQVEAQKWVVVEMSINASNVTTIKVDGEELYSGAITNADGTVISTLPYITFRSGRAEDADKNPMYTPSNSTVDFDNIVVYNTGAAIVVPTVVPTTEPTVVPTVEPTVVPTTEPTVKPTPKPTQAPLPTDAPYVENQPAIEATTTVEGDTATISVGYKDVNKDEMSLSTIEFKLFIDPEIYTVDTTSYDVKTEKLLTNVNYSEKTNTLTYLFSAGANPGNFISASEGELMTFKVKVNQVPDQDWKYRLDFTSKCLAGINPTDKSTVSYSNDKVNSKAPVFTVGGVTPTATPEPTPTQRPTQPPLPTDAPYVDGQPAIEATTTVEGDTATISVGYKDVNKDEMSLSTIEFKLFIDPEIYTVDTTSYDVKTEKLLTNVNYSEKTNTLTYLFSAGANPGNFISASEGELMTFKVKINQIPDQTWKYRLEFTSKCLAGINPTDKSTVSYSNDKVNSKAPVFTIEVAEPTVPPTVVPTTKPTATPTVKPTATPTQKPTATPTRRPSGGNGNGGSGSGSGQIAPGNPTANPSGTSFTGTVKGGGNAIGTMTGSNTFTVIVRVNGQMQSQFTGFDPVVVRAPYSLGAANLANLVVVDQNGNVVPRSRYSNGYMVTALKNTSGTFTIKEITKSFGDVNHPWAQEAIGALAAREIINGVGENLFDPDASVTREQFAKMVVTMFDVLDSSAPLNFSDVDASGWSAAYIATAQKLGIVTGYEDNTFRPNQTITREEMSTILYRAAKNLGVNITPVKEGVTFTDDASIQSWAKEAVSEMQKAGILQGVGDNAFDPANNASRAQSAVAIYNMFVASLS